MNKGVLGFLSSTRSLIGFLIATLAIFAGFYFVLQAIDGPLLDMMMSGDRAIVRLNQLSDDQSAVHFWATITLDVAYPLAYGGLLIGLLSRLAWRWRWLLILVPVIAALADYAENLVQAMALSGYASEILHAKDIVTPLKSGALILSLVLCVLLGAGRLIFRSPNKDDKEDMQI